MQHTWSMPLAQPRNLFARLVGKHVAYMSTLISALDYHAVLVASFFSLSRVYRIVGHKALPAALDAALLLVLALMDKALVDIDDDVKDLSTMPASALEPSGFVDVRIEPSAADTLVMRRIESSASATAFGYTVNAVEGLGYIGTEGQVAADAEPSTSSNGRP
ncbi:uncharacterized protein PSFLO_03338 [Pseudozyma flocculosa]|uniref:Uncharacterized protein n=1 Tax=Pseudozyma flocculosa TaxID=84751 RepID=A0A5C3F3L6_9BASI|nr:uncharacterized protein PSFLO_03338 [Pseudozyma flocculosa]